MTQKLYAKPPKTILVAQIFIIPLFMIFGFLLFFIADSEVRIFVAIFIVIWQAGCIAILVNAIKILKQIRNGKIEIAEISSLVAEEGGNFAEKLRALEALKKDGLIADDEYRNKRSEIMQKKW